MTAQEKVDASGVIVGVLTAMNANDREATAMLVAGLSLNELRAAFAVACGMIAANLELLGHQQGYTYDEMLDRAGAVQLLLPNRANKT
jgi:hypothetical protein